MYSIIIRIPDNRNWKPSLYIVTLTYVKVEWTLRMNPSKLGLPFGLCGRYFGLVPTFAHSIPNEQFLHNSSTAWQCPRLLLAISMVTRHVSQLARYPRNTCTCLHVHVFARVLVIHCLIRTSCRLSPPNSPLIGSPNTTWLPFSALIGSSEFTITRALFRVVFWVGPIGPWQAPRI